MFATVGILRARTGRLVLVAALCALLASCSAADGTGSGAATTTAPASAAAQASGQYPNAVVVLGHSGATGYDSDTKAPETDARQNSWATGDNPAVDSIYLRLLALNPAVRGHNTNLAVAGTSTTTGRSPAASRARGRPTAAPDPATCSTLQASPSRPTGAISRGSPCTISVSSSRCAPSSRPAGTTTTRCTTCGSPPTTSPPATVPTSPSPASASRPPWNGASSAWSTSEQFSVACCGDWQQGPRAGTSEEIVTIARRR